MTIISHQVSHKSFLLLLMGGSIVGFGPILAKVIDAPAISIVLYRIMLPIPILVLLKFFKPKNISNYVTKNVRNDFMLMGAIGFLFALDLIAFYISLSYTSVASATLISNLSPVFLVAYSLLIKKAWSKEIIWPLLAVMGLVLLCGLKTTNFQQELLGNSIALLAAVFFTGYIVLVNKLGKQYGSVDIMLWSSAGGTFFLIILCMILQTNIQITSTHDLIFLLLMSWGTQLIGQTILTKGIATFPPSLSSLGILIDPIAAACFAWILLGESLTMLEIMGASLILISIVCAYKYNLNQNNKEEVVSA